MPPKSRCVPMSRPFTDPRPPFRFDSCPGEIRMGMDGNPYLSDGTQWIRIRKR